MFLIRCIQRLLIIILLIILGIFSILAQATDSPTLNIKTEQQSQGTANQPEEKPWHLRSTDNLTSLIGSGVVFITSLVGYSLVLYASIVAYRQWRHDLRWKQLEVLMGRIKAFNETPGTMNAIMMLFSEDREVPLFDKEKPEDKYERVNSDEVSRALIPSDMLRYPYDPKLQAIRDSFNDLLGRLSHIEAFLEAELLGEKEGEIILDNLLLRFERFKNEKDNKLWRNLRIYISHNEMKRVQTLVKRFKRFNLDLEENIDEEKEKLKQEIENGDWNLPTRVANRESWRNLPLPEMRSRISLDREFTISEYEQISSGFIPDKMEDKWFIFLEGEDLYFHRSWTGYCIYHLRIIPFGEKFKVVKALVNRDPTQYIGSDDNYDVMIINFVIDNFLLNQREIE